MTPDHHTTPNDRLDAGRDDATLRRRRAAFALAGAILLLCLGAAGYFLLLDDSREEHAHEAGMLYTCPMHPQVIRDEPGTCPICHMDLVPMRASAAPGTGNDSAASHAVRVTMTPEERIVANVGTAEAGYRAVAAQLEVAGAIDYNEATHRVVTARFGGRIERLYVKETGQYVRAGEPLMEIYSPELVTAQQDYLLARETSTIRTPAGLGGDDGAAERAEERRGRLLRASRKRLELLGMSSAQIAALEQRGEIAYQTTVFSPASGVVIRRGITDGAYVNEGALLLELADLSSVWVLASVYESDVRRMKPGLPMMVTGPALGGERRQGRVQYIYPTVDPETRTVQVRGLFANADMLLKPGMYVSVSIGLPAGDVLAVPASAVVRTGRRDLVYVEVAANTFEPREVRTGVRDDGYYEIVEGELRAGDRVVTEGGFLIDSESRLSGAAMDHSMSRTEGRQ